MDSAKSCISLYGECYQHDISKPRQRRLEGDPRKPYLANVTPTGFAGSTPSFLRQNAGGENSVRVRKPSVRNGSEFSRILLHPRKRDKTIMKLSTSGIYKRDAEDGVSYHLKRILGNSVTLRAQVLTVILGFGKIVRR